MVTVLEGDSSQYFSKLYHLDFLRCDDSEYQHWAEESGYKEHVKREVLWKEDIDKSVLLWLQRGYFFRQIKQQSKQLLPDI